jgi:hypothetical protein
LRHVRRPETNAAVDGNDAPSPSKAARTILSAPNQVKIASEPSSYLIYFTLFEFSSGQRWRDRRTATAGHAIGELPVAVAAASAVPAIAHPRRISGLLTQAPSGLGVADGE